MRAPLGVEACLDKCRGFWGVCRRRLKRSESGRWCKHRRICLRSADRLNASKKVCCLFRHCTVASGEGEQTNVPSVWCHRALRLMWKKQWEQIERFTTLIMKCQWEHRLSFAFETRAMIKVFRRTIGNVVLLFFVIGVREQYWGSE